MTEDYDRPLTPAECWACAAIIMAVIGIILGAIGLGAHAPGVANAGGFTLLAAGAAWWKALHA